MSEPKDSSSAEHQKRLVPNGAKPDGSYVVSVQLRVTPKDEVAFRAANLINPDHFVGGEGSPDLGMEAAVTQYISRMFHMISDEQIKFGQTDVICGWYAAKVPPAPSQD